MSKVEAPEAIPIVDLESGDRHHTRAAIATACEELGFFFVTGHGISKAITDGLLGSMRRFFDEDAPTKMAVRRSQREPWGYYDRELTKNRRDAKEIFDCGPPDDDRHRTPWPTAHPALRDNAMAYARAARRTTLEILAILSEALGTSGPKLAESVPPRNGSFLRLNYYPPASRESSLESAGDGATRRGVHEHTDAGALTLLLQDDQAGLEASLAGSWQLIHPVPGALLVNLGDVVQVWSNDRFHAPLHRVRASKARPRFSAPFFMNPAYEAICEPLASTVSPDTPARYRPFRWGEFRELRATGDYHDVGREVQIDDYRIDDTSPAATSHTS